jgi:hypothetical protein
MHALYAMCPCSYSSLLDSAGANRDRHTVVQNKIHHLGAILFAYIGAYPPNHRIRGDEGEFK